MTNEQIKMKKTLENRESVLDISAHEIFRVLKIEGNHEILISYYDTLDLIQKKIKSEFPEGTLFDNFE